MKFKKIVIQFDAGDLILAEELICTTRENTDPIPYGCIAVKKKPDVE